MDRRLDWRLLTHRQPRAGQVDQRLQQAEAEPELPPGPPQLVRQVAGAIRPRELPNNKRRRGNDQPEGQPPRKRSKGYNDVRAAKIMHRKSS
jgi:hypothetical protein